ncbi:hypothetical protein FGO68_gene1980 [Halteria grandinella]|uniref:Uncharacterized protein n=1 Tax=Halteria grandinella TaxID=5974 RepID=A0A8J8P8J4_HALGN|nr:hypothetical protein FGO68_gene1980 [Halteria grandinella]
MIARVHSIAADLVALALSAFRVSAAPSPVNLASSATVAWLVVAIVALFPVVDHAIAAFVPFPIASTILIIIVIAVLVVITPSIIVAFPEIPSRARKGLLSGKEQKHKGKDTYSLNTDTCPAGTIRIVYSNSLP